MKLTNRRAEVAMSLVVVAFVSVFACSASGQVVGIPVNENEVIFPIGFDPDRVDLTGPNQRHGRFAIGFGPTYEWTGGDEDTYLQLWAGDPVYGWKMIEDSVPATDGQYHWQNCMEIGYFKFGAWVNPGDDDWYYIEAPERQLLGQIPFGVTDPDQLIIRDVYLASASIDNETIIQGDNYQIEIAGTLEGARVQLWAGDTLIVDDYNLTDGYLWDTSDMAPGRYVLSAWCTYSVFPDWYYIEAPGVLYILPEDTIIGQTHVPEPASAAFLIVGLSVLVARRRKRRQIY